MLGIHRTNATLFGRGAARAPTDHRPAHHRRRRAWKVEYLEERTLLSQFSVTNLNDHGGGSLRQAIVDSNNTTGPNEIDFASGLNGTITLTSGELLIQNNAVTILGPGQNLLSVSGNANSRVFEVASGVTASLSGITITGGKADDGGGISNHGAVTVNACTISGNRANNGGGAVFDDGSNFTAMNCTFSGNSSRYAGAVAIAGNSSSAIGCTFSGNSSSWNGGAVYVGSTTGSSLSASNCTFSGNSGSSGGAINVTSSGSVMLTNCTISGNSASDGLGSGVYVSGSLGSINTIYQNPRGNIYVSPAQYLYMTSRTVYIPGGNFGSGGHNIFSDTPAPALDPTDFVNTDPLLGPLADNGGPTLTQALQPGSPAIDAGMAVSGLTTDQRGIPRPQGNAFDIGAFEVEVPHTGFYAVSEPSIAYGTATVTVSGYIEFGKQIPTGTVMITLNNVAQSAPIDPVSGHFSAVLAPTGLHVAGSPYAITYTYAGGGDWPAATATEPLAVTPAPLTIVANDTSVVFGSNPTLTATYSGFISGDSISSLTQPVILSTSAAAYSPPGRYEITAAGAASPDYAITYVNGWVTVTQPQARHERTCVAIVTSLYQDMLGRAAEPKGLRFWMGRMDAGARAANVAQKIWTSAEHRSLVHHHTAPKISYHAALKHALSAGKRASRSKG